MNSQKTTRSASNPERTKSALLRGSIGSALAQATGRVLALIIGIALARNLGAAGYGVYAYALAWLTIGAMLAEGGAGTMLVRGVAEHNLLQDWARLRGLIETVFLFAITTSLSAMALGVAVAILLDGKVGAEMSSTLFVAAVLLPATVVAKLNSSIVIGLRHAVKGDSFENVVRPGLFLVGILILFMTYPTMRTPQAALLLQLGATVVTVIISAIVILSLLPKPALSASGERKGHNVMASAGSLTLLAGAALINNHADVIMLGIFRSADEIGVYRVAAQGAALVPVGLQIVNVVFAPHIAAAFASGDAVVLQRLVSRGARLVVALGAPLALIFVLYGGDIAGFLFGSEFAGAGVALAILSIGFLINIAMGPVGLILRMTKNERLSARIMAVAAVANIVLNALLIPVYGIEGAATATAISLAASHLVLWWVVRKKLGIRPDAARI